MMAMPWSMLTRDLIFALREKLAQANLAPNTIGTYLSAARAVSREAWLSGDLSADEYQRIRTIKRPAGKRIGAGRSLSDIEIQRLLAACQNGDARSIRDLALLALMLGCGLRRAEVVALNYEALSWTDNELRVWQGQQGTLPADAAGCGAGPAPLGRPDPRRVSRAFVLPYPPGR
jgi:site-specific recombinase XerC